MPDTGKLRLPPDATADEAAAITAAVERWLAAEARAGGNGRDSGDPWEGRRFAFAGRVAKLTGESIRVPDGAPGDPWTAMGRLDRD